MRVIAVEIPSKSHGIRVWPELEPGLELPEDKSPYSFACNLVHIDENTCEVTQAIGDFSNEVAIGIGLKAIELGYTQLIFCRSQGGPATRWATYLKTDNGLDYYQVNLVIT